ncbi:MAG: glycosyltransferase [Planctomycetia bacterium]|nr:glycosyltransferase [Planctomycetia bacterium]
MSELAPLIVFSDDWGRHPSSCQHLIAKLLSHRRVTWVNTIGTRPPRLDWATLTRGLGKLNSWLWANPARKGSGSAVTPHTALAGGVRQPTVLNPKMWPSFRSRFARGLNRRLLTRAIRRIAEAMPAPPVVITTLPLVADLVDGFPASRWVYYCVDDFSAWPGLDGHTLRDMEAELVPKMDVVIAVSETLQTHLAKLGKPSHLLTHGVDLDFWRKPIASDTQVSLREVDALPQPLVVFWGVLDRRTDVAFVRRLAEVMTEGTILFAGPRDNPDAELLRLPRVRTLPPLPFEELPTLAARAKVLIAPYADLPVTRAMQPLKLKEYIATGKPVVVRKLPATEPWADCVDVVETPEAFASAVLERLRTGVPEEQQRARVRLESESWSAKAEQFERWVDGE